jgi:hypothetical protein
VALERRAAADDLRLLATYMARELPGGLGDAIPLILTAAHRVIAPTGHGACMAPCLAMIAGLVEERSIKTRQRGSLRDRNAQSMAVGLAARLTDYEYAILEMRIGQIGKDATRWWLSINDSPGLLHRLTYLS